MTTTNKQTVSFVIRYGLFIAFRGGVAPVPSAGGGATGQA